MSRFLIFFLFILFILLLLKGNDLLLLLKFIDLGSYTLPLSFALQGNECFLGCLP